MDRFISTITAKKSDVAGICQKRSVVTGVVTAAATYGLRLLDTARALLARLNRRLSEGHWMALCGHRPFVLAAAWSPAPRYAGLMRQRREGRRSRAGSRRGLGRF